MKHLVTLVLGFILAIPVFSQVEMGKTKQTIMGKKKLLALETDKIMLDNFSVNLVLYNYAQDEGGSSNVALSAKVGVRANLTEVDEALSKEITDEVYSYFVKKWKERGVEVFAPTKEEIEASKKYSKAAKKGKAEIINGKTWNNQSKKNHNIMAWPSGVNIASSGSGPMAAFGNSKNILPDYKGNFFYTGFNADVNFISFKTAKLGSTASVKSFPQLKSSNNLTVTKWQKTKVGGYIGSNAAEGIEDFYSEIKDDEVGALNSKVVMKNYVADKTKFKANVLEMIQKGMDDMFADYDAIAAAEK